MRIEKGNGHDMYPYVWVLVDADELMCDVRALPYSTWIGTIRLDTGKISVWTPAASIPRGYKRAALAVLEEAKEALLKGALPVRGPRLAP